MISFLRFAACNLKSFIKVVIEMSESAVGENANLRIDSSHSVKSSSAAVSDPDNSTLTGPISRILSTSSEPTNSWKTPPRSALVSQHKAIHGLSLCQHSAAIQSVTGSHGSSDGSIVPLRGLG